MKLMKSLDKLLLFLYDYMTVTNEITGWKWRYLRVNHWNRFISKILNNRLSAWIKELFYVLFGMPYSEYLCWDNLMDSGEVGYVREVRKTYQTENIILRWFRLLFNLEIVNFETDLASDPKFALDVSKLGLIKKLQLRKDVNRAFNTKEFKFKRVLTYYEGLTDSKK